MITSREYKELQKKYADHFNVVAWSTSGIPPSRNTYVRLITTCNQLLNQPSFRRWRVCRHLWDGARCTLPMYALISTWKHPKRTASNCYPINASPGSPGSNFWTGSAKLQRLSLVRHLKACFQELLAMAEYEDVQRSNRAKGNQS